MNKVTPEQIDALLDRVEYITVNQPGDTTTTLVLAYLDGKFHLATGLSACVDPANFDPDRGYDIAKEKAETQARIKLWELEGYRLYQKLNQDIPAPKAEVVEDMPTLGETVLYYEQIEGKESAPMPAFVASIDGASTVSLAVLDRNGKAHPRQHVRMVPKDSIPEGLPYYARHK